MQLIQSKIVPASQNIFWQNLPESWCSLTPKKVLILTLPYLNGSAEEATLLKMLGACKLTDTDYHILSLEEQQRVGWPQIAQQLQPGHILLLGINPAHLGIHALFRLNAPNQFGNGVFIPSQSLPQLIQMQDMRTVLWQQGLRPVFSA